MIRAFSEATQKSLGFYVYALVNPLTNKIFYVGKGKDDRVFEHESSIQANNVTSNANNVNNTELEKEKIKTIKEIQRAGLEVKHYIIRHGLEEKEAYLVESVLINLLTEKDFNNDVLLTNIQAGHGQYEYGIMTAEDAEAKYTAPVLVPHDELLCININRLYSSNISIYEATRKSWILSIPHANKCKYVLAEYRGLVRAIFEVDEKGWQPLPGDPRRKFFDGKEVTDPKITSQYLNHRLPSKKRGQANPVRYIK